MSLLVKDAAGATQSVETLPAKGAASAAQSLPVAIATEQLAALAPMGRSASSVALAGSAAASGTHGPFTPELGRPIWVTLSGVWAGSVQLLRSTDGGATKLPITFSDGSVRGLWTGPVNAAVVEESCAGATYYLQFTRTSGTLVYEVRQ